MLPRQRFSKAISMVFLVHATLVSAAASINCDKANTDQDKVICSNEKLHILDMELAILLSDSQPAPGRFESEIKEISRKVKTDQKIWLKERFKIKASDIAGLENHYKKRIRVVADANDVSILDEDWNCDGTKDFSFSESEGKYDYTHVYVYLPKLKKFAARFAKYGLEIDPKTCLITSHESDGYAQLNATDETYKWINGSFVLLDYRSSRMNGKKPNCVEPPTQDPNRDCKKCDLFIVTTKKMVDGKLVTDERKVDCEGWSTTWMHHEPRDQK